MKLPDGHRWTRAEALTDTQRQEIAGLHLCMPEAWGGISQDSSEARTRFASSWVEQSATGSLFLQALLSDTEAVRAFLWAELKRDTVHIHSLWVAPELRRQGIARHLKLALEAWARDHGARHIRTHVHVNNPSMRQLNASLGYVDTHVWQHKALDSGPVDAVPEADP